MNHSDQIRAVASDLQATRPDLAAVLVAIAVGVRRMERTLDEIVAEAMEEEQQRYASASVPPPSAEIVRLADRRREPDVGLMILGGH